MKNSILIILAAFALVFTSCQKDDVVDIIEIPTTTITTTNNTYNEVVVEDGAFLQEEVPQYNVQVRSLTPNIYVKEITVMQLTEAGQANPVINFDENTYIDNGRHHDLVANDGIYTSTTTFTHDAEVPFRD